MPNKRSEQSIARVRPRVYKQLRPNDLGVSTNQGGPAIPSELLPYFPPLPYPPKGPTEEYFLIADLFDGPQPKATVTCRWHYQTWGNSRPPEHRLTQNLQGALLGTAAVDDILTFERQADRVDRYRITLVRGSNWRHADILAANGNSRWGSVAPRLKPLALSGIEAETESITSESTGTFEMFQDRLWEGGRRLIREAAFSRVLKRAYDHRCAACNTGYLVPVDDPSHEPPSEPEAAHIVPVALKGSDDIRNGLCLCRAHHWAFDRHIIFVDDEMVWRVTDASKRENRNNTLNDIEGAPLIPPIRPYPGPSSDALRWHREQALP